MSSQRRQLVFAGLIGLTIFIVGLSPWLIVKRGWRTKSPEIITHQELWPHPIQELLESTKVPPSSVTVLKVDAFVDEKSVCLISDAQKLIDELVQQENLEPATTEHPKLTELQKCLPSTWSSPSLSTARIWASTGYGTEHIEGPHLLLLVHEPDTDSLYILHERIF